MLRRVIGTSRVQTDSTKLSQGSPSKPRTRGFHPALDALRLTFLLQSQTFSWALGKGGSCLLSPRHNLIFWRLRWNQRHWGEYCIACRGQRPPLCAHQGQISHGLQLCISQRILSLCSWKKEGDNHKEWKVAPQLCISSGEIKRWTEGITRLLSLLPRKSKEKGKSTAPS